MPVMNTPTTEPTPAYLRRRDAARYLGVSESLIRKLERSGEFPCAVRLNRAVVYPRQALDNLMATRAR